MIEVVQHVQQGLGADFRGTSHAEAPLNCQRLSFFHSAVGYELIIPRQGQKLAIRSEPLGAAQE